MSALRFNDGLTIETSGDYRVTRKWDGYYVVGHGVCIPVASREEGADLIADLESV